MADIPLGTIGLLTDILGAILLFFYGLPNHIPINKTNEVPLRIIEKQLREDGQLNPEYSRYKSRSRCGIVLLIIGFALQIAGNYQS